MRERVRVASRARAPLETGGRVVPEALVTRIFSPRARGRLLDRLADVEAEVFELLGGLVRPGVVDDSGAEGRLAAARVAEDEEVREVVEAEHVAADVGRVALGFGPLGDEAFELAGAPRARQSLLETVEARGADERHEPLVLQTVEHGDAPRPRHEPLGAPR